MIPRDAEYSHPPDVSSTNGNEVPRKGSGLEFGRTCWSCRPPLAVLGLLCLLSALIVDFDLDVMISGWCHGNEVTGPWPWANTGIWPFLTNFGHIPGILVGAWGLVLIALDLWRRRWGDGFRCGLFLVLTLLIGPGLLVNVLVKDCWNRARPREIVEFGGTEAFTPFSTPGNSPESKSFPSGHASIAFYLLMPAFVFWKRGARGIGDCWLAVGLVYGLLMGLARVIQGAHFPSDVLGSAAIVYGCGLCLAWLTVPIRSTEGRVRPRLELASIPPIATMLPAQSLDSGD